MDLSTLLSYYNRKDIQEAIISASHDREVAVRYGDGGFGKRPDVLKYPNDVIELAKQGATSFHVSEERWRNPLQLDTSLRQRELDELRTGWDLVLDIDCQFLEFSAIAADLVVKALRHHGVSSVSAKFSGNHGFHIGVPFEAFPERVSGRETRLLFPEGPIKIAFYLKEMIKPPLAASILEGCDINCLMKKSGKPFGELVKAGAFDPFSILDIDTILISSRHLYRMPYSFNEKSGLISVPIEPSRILEFDRGSAKPGLVEVSKFGFLGKAEPGCARNLIMHALDFSHKEEEKKIEEMREYEAPAEALSEKFFPPCINGILAGIEDGRKRSVFILVNFLTSLGWGYDAIGKLLDEWNKRNRQPLKPQLVLGQLSYHKKLKKRFLPPNCDNMGYYKGFGVCKPDNLCLKVRNPVNYSLRKARYAGSGKKEKPGAKSAAKPV